MKKFQKFLMEMGEVPAAAPAAATPPKPNIGSDYGKLRQQVAATVKNLEEVLQKYEEKMQEFYAILGTKGAAISGKMAGQNRQIQTMTSEVQELGKQIAEMKQQHEEEVRNLKSRISELEAKATELEKGNQNVSKQVENANQTLEMSMLKVKQLESDLGEAQRKFDERVKDHNDTIGQKAQASRDLEGEKSAHAVTRGERDAEKTGRDTLESAYNQLQQMQQQMMEFLQEENSRLAAELKQMGDEDAFVPSTHKKKTLASKEFNPMSSPDFSGSVGPHGPEQQVSHTDHGGFGLDLREHLERARKKQGYKNTW